MAEMERAIFKRDSIAIRGKAKQQMRGGDTKADLRKMLADMGKRAKDLELETQRHERSVRQLDEEGRQVGQRMEEAGVAVREVQREEEDLQEQMFRIDRDKRRLKEEAYALQRLAKRYEALARGQPRRVPGRNVSHHASPAMVVSAETSSVASSEPQDLASPRTMSAAPRGGSVQTPGKMTLQRARQSG